MSTKLSALAFASAIAGAISLAAATTSPALAQAKVKCYGIAKAGQNDCAPASGAHSCAGQSKVNYDGGDWKSVANEAACTAAGGSVKPFAGMNPKAPKS
jgi:uncharacterized membrane protein